MSGKSPASTIFMKICSSAVERDREGERGGGEREGETGVVGHAKGLQLGLSKTATATHPSIVVVSRWTPKVWLQWRCQQFQSSKCQPSEAASSFDWIGGQGLSRVQIPKCFTTCSIPLNLSAIYVQPNPVKAQVQSKHVLQVHRQPR